MWSSSRRSATETAALRDFDPTYDRCGSEAANTPLDYVRFTLKADKEQTSDISRRHGCCSDHWLRSVLVMVRLGHRQLVWIDATPHHTGCQRKTLGEILEWRFHSALFLACDGRLLQIELALDASARLVGNFALAQQPVDEFTLRGNQIGSEFRDSGSSFEPI
jgi:hypothetical protein